MCPIIALTITDKKDFTKKLFLQETFDAFEVAKADISTSNTISIDGTLNLDYFDEAERNAYAEQKRERSLWQELRPLCFSIIRGKKTPRSFKIILQLSKSQREAPPFLDLAEFDPDISFCLTIHFTGESLTCTSGTFRSSFSLDQSYVAPWDTAVEAFFAQNGFSFVNA